MTSDTSQRIDCRRLPPFGVVEDRDTQHGRLLTPRSLALAAACLLSRQDLWGAPGSARRGLGGLSLVGSLCLAAGGCYDENGDPSPPEEEAAAEVLTCTCELLAAELAQRDVESDQTDPTGHAEPVTPEQRLGELVPVGSADSADLQLLLAAVHGVRPPI